MGSHGIIARQAVAWLSQSAALKPALRSALAAFAHWFFCTSQLRFKAAFRLRKSALLLTWKPRPPSVTAGAEICPRAPAKAWRLAPLAPAVAAVAVVVVVIVLVSMKLVEVAAGVSVTVTVTVAAHLVAVAVASAAAVVLVAAALVVSFPPPPTACKLQSVCSQNPREVFNRLQGFLPQSRRGRASEE